MPSVPPTFADPVTPGSVRIGKRFRFEAGHRLVSLGEDHPCSRQHGHSYTVEVVLETTRLTLPGFVTDFADLAPLRQYLDTELDHRNLHEVLGFEPTSELLAIHLAQWVQTHVEPTIRGRLAAMRVSETASTWAEYAPPPSDDGSRP